MYNIKLERILYMNKIRIAKNFHTYIITELTDDFWDKWKSNKEELKAKGYCPFKKDNKYYLSLYDGNVVTETEYLQQNIDYFKSVRSELIKYFNKSKHHYTIDEFNAIREIICNEKTLDGLNKIENYSDNYKYILKEIENKLFEEMITR
jgi:hypothetical protein